MRIVKRVPQIIMLILMLSVLLYVGAGFVFGWTEDRTFEAQRTEGFQQADKILIENGLCLDAAVLDVDMCREKL
ncbi:MAG: hypothetical protein P4L50_01765 [Anaerolineaceae bacterium]|nr:hypothetical protein [Alphaproteobacteria bacterium]MDR3572564.1 hypothetical protein [Anaerolineaceae bacterium]